MLAENKPRNKITTPLMNGQFLLCFGTLMCHFYTYHHLQCVERSGKDHWVVGDCTTLSGHIPKGHGEIYFKGKIK